MRLLALTDAYDGKSIEYVVVEKIQHIQPLSKYVYMQVTDRKIVGIKNRNLMEFICCVPNEPIYDRPHGEMVKITGSSIYLNNGHKTNVFESPENIAEMLIEGNFLTVDDNQTTPKKG